tara:strand:- start:1126 stop:1284 length:159 start_codon:yes stop_codon:yes gene_type:complete
MKILNIGVTGFIGLSLVKYIIYNQQITMYQKEFTKLEASLKYSIESYLKNYF